jgi:glycosyltransferase involved in cell wall biosynthesis
VLRIIARLNVGGPAIHTLLLTAGLNDEIFRSILVSGRPGEQEGDMSYLARELGVEPTVIPEIGRELSWRDDLIAFRKLVKLIRALRPHIVHTHTAKAGAIGRLAALVAGVPIRVHTFHGHVFRGYFGPLTSRVYIWIERFLGRFTDCVVAISERQRHDLCNVYRVIPGRRCVVIPLGFDLHHFAASENRRGEIRRVLGCPEGRQLIGTVGRLVPIKNHQLFLEMARRILDVRDDVGFVIVGDGELRHTLERSAEHLGLSGHVYFLGWRRDLDAVYADLDVVALTSINEGTPVALIEAMAAGRSVVSTDVGGVADVVEHEKTGLLVPSGDAAGCARAVLRLLGDPSLRERMGRAGRERVLARYGGQRLVGDVRSLYLELLAQKGERVAAKGA